MVRYLMVLLTASSGVDMTATMGFTKQSRIAVRATDSSMNKDAVLPTAKFTCLRSCAPTARPVITVVPIASPTIMTVSMCMT